MRARRNANGFAYSAHRGLNIPDPDHRARAVILHSGPFIAAHKAICCAADTVGTGRTAGVRRYTSTPAAALRPSEIAHTTSDCPRLISPAAKTPGTDDM